MIEFNNCCFCFPLRTGSLIIGYLSLISAIFVELQTSFVLIVALEQSCHGCIAQGAGAVILILISVIVLTLIFIVFNIVLLVGLHKDKPRYVKAYLIFASIIIALSVVLFFVNIGNNKSELLVVIEVIVGIALNTYYLLVIRSHYMRMKDQDLNQI